MTLFKCHLKLKTKTDTDIESHQHHTRQIICLQKFLARRSKKNQPTHPKKCTRFSFRIVKLREILQTQTSLEEFNLLLWHRWTVQLIRLTSLERFQLLYCITENVQFIIVTLLVKVQLLTMISLKGFKSPYWHHCKDLFCFIDISGKRQITTDTLANSYTVVISLTPHTDSHY